MLHWGKCQCHSDCCWLIIKSINVFTKRVTGWCQIRKWLLIGCQTYIKVIFLPAIQWRAVTAKSSVVKTKLSCELVLEYKPPYQNPSCTSRVAAQQHDWHWIWQCSEFVLRCTGCVSSLLLWQSRAAWAVEITNFSFASLQGCTDKLQLPFTGLDKGFEVTRVGKVLLYRDSSDIRVPSAGIMVGTERGEHRRQSTRQR